MGRNNFSDMLRAAMAATPDPALSEKTRKEQEVGRDRIMASLRASVVDVGVLELQRRFSKRNVPTAALRFDETNNRWMVDVVVQAAAKRVMQFEDELLDFPSDHLIAQVALVT